jgi:hypothetical protein
MSRFDCPPLRTSHVLPMLGFKSNLGGQLARSIGQSMVARSGLMDRFTPTPKLNFKTPAFDKILGAPVFIDYRGARRRAGRRYGLLVDLAPPETPASAM